MEPETILVEGCPRIKEEPCTSDTDNEECDTEQTRIKFEDDDYVLPSAVPKLECEVSMDEADTTETADYDRGYMCDVEPIHTDIMKCEQKMSVKSFKTVDKCCNKKCYEIPETEQVQFFIDFWDLGHKDKQDTVLMGFLDKHAVKQTGRGAQIKKRECTWAYHMRSMTGDHFVCRAFLLKLLQISEKRLRTVQNKVKLGNFVIKDMRGKHTNRPHKIGDKIYELALKHLSAIPHHKSHSATSDRSYFENPNITVKQLYHSFTQYYFDHTQTELKMKYCTYHKFFKERSPIYIKHFAQNVK